MAALGKAVSSSSRVPSPQTYIPLAVAMCVFRPTGPRCGRAQERQRLGRGLAAGGRQFRAGPLWGLGQVPLTSATGCLAGLQGSTGSRPDMRRVLNKRVYCYVTVLAELLQAIKSLEVCVCGPRARSTAPHTPRRPSSYSHTYLGQQLRCRSLSHPSSPHSLWPPTNTLYTYSEIADVYFPTF